jgi:general stress protein 26
MIALTIEHVLEVSRAMLRRTTYCFLISHGFDGWCSTRLVQPILDENEEFVLWFGTNPLLRKVREIESNSRVTVAIQDDEEHANLVLYGTATVERNVSIREKRWMASWRPFFPGGPASKEYVALRFETERLEVLNFKRNIAPTPFGLRSAVLLKRSGSWNLADAP